MQKKRSFFERLSGSSGDDFDTFDEELIPPAPTTAPRPASVAKVPVARAIPAEEEPIANASAGAGQLPVDVHQTQNDIVIRAFVAGVAPTELNISISRDMVQIEGSRMEREQVSEPDYFVRELFWGAFSRTIMLPEEVDVEASTASAKDGLLTLILPKLDKAKQTKLKVRAG